MSHTMEKARVYRCTLIFSILCGIPFLLSTSHGAVLPTRSTTTTFIHRHRLRKPPSIAFGGTAALHEDKEDEEQDTDPSIRGAAAADIFFEVSRPVNAISREDTTGSVPDCSILVVQHEFANTYSLPPATASYTGPPARCVSNGTSTAAQDYQIVLKWSGSCKGRQFDRISGLWFGGVEILRTCTAEPTSRGVYWEVKKDVSRFFSVFMSPQNVVLELANVVDTTYTGVFHINITLEFYRRSHSDDVYGHGEASRIDNAAAVAALFPTDGPADVIIPISNSEPLPGLGHWLQVSSENETAKVVFRPPSNIVRAVLEVCISFHGDDEFWYTNPPNDYLEANGLSDEPGNGPFREVQVFLDDDGTQMVGAAWPFPTIFTGGINPLYWRPAAAIGAFNLPTYDIELTPFLGLLLDGNNHTISMRVKNADGSWPLGANLHLWLDPHTLQTSGTLLTYHVPPLLLHDTSSSQGLDGEFHTNAQRFLSFSAYIISSFGTIFVNVSYSFAFNNVMLLHNNSSVQIVTQDIQTKGEVVVAEMTSNVTFSQQTTHTFPLYLYCSLDSGDNVTYTQECNLTHAFNKESSTISSLTNTYSFESLKNWQAAEGNMIVVGSSVTAGVGALQQEYQYADTLGCYNRVLSTRNYSILFDSIDMACESSKVQ